MPNVWRWGMVVPKHSPGSPHAPARRYGSPIIVWGTVVPKHCPGSPHAPARRYGSPIIDLKFHTAGAGGGADTGLITRRVVSSDKHIIKIWDAGSEWLRGRARPGGGG
jgi:hypothetical protein